MAMMMDYMFRERDNIVGLDKAIEKIVDANGRFDGEDVTRYMKSYKTKMRMRGIYPWQGNIQVLEGSSLQAFIL